LVYATRFPLKVRDGSNGDGDTVEITVYDYYMKKGIKLDYSGGYPCINAGKAKRPTYFPVEVCFSFACLHP
jgi:eukaryotic translation initiation factor 2C